MPSVAEQMTHDLFLDPALDIDDEPLLGAIESEIDDTAAEAKNAPKPTQPD